MLELLVSLALLTVLFGGVVLTLASAQHAFQRSEAAEALNQQLRSAEELMTQDISQAGLTGTSYGSSTYKSLTGNENPVELAELTDDYSAGTAAYSVSTTAGMFVGQTLFVGTGANQESIIVKEIDTSASTFTTSLGQSHSKGDPIFPHGVFADGVIPNTASTWPSSKYALHLYGDLQGNGTIAIVDYVCPSVAISATSTMPKSYTDSTGTIWAPLMRYEYDNAIATGSVTLPTSTMKVLDMVAVSSNGCFTYSTVSQSVNALSGSYSPVFVTAVVVTIRAMAGVLSNDGTTLIPLFDPQTHQPIVTTRSFQIQPRNIIASYNYAHYSYVNGWADGELMSMPPTIETMIGALQ